MTMTAMFVDRQTSGNIDFYGFFLPLANVYQHQFLSGLPRSGKKFLKMKNFPGQGKVRELHFQSGKVKKNEKSH